MMEMADDDGDSFGDDADGEDEDDEDEEEEEEEEHLAPADSAIVVPVDEPVFLPEGIEPVIPPPSTDLLCRGLRLSVRTSDSNPFPNQSMPQPTPFITTPVPSPLLPSSVCPTQIQTLRIASTQALIDAVIVALPLPPLPPSLYIPPPMTIWMRFLSLSSHLAKKRQQGIRDVGYGIRGTWVDPVEAVPEIAPMTVGEVNTRVIELAEFHENDTQTRMLLLEMPIVGSRISQRVDIDSQ
ncbi:hypothetical protein Tco_1359465 [Tanacetum coccineum]